MQKQKLCNFSKVSLFRAAVAAAASRSMVVGWTPAVA